MRIWVGGLPDKVTVEEVREKFEKFGKINDISLNNRHAKQPPFAFVE